MRNPIKFLSALFLILAPQTLAAASHQRDLAAQVEAAGFNDFEDRRHEIRIEHCTMTTFVYEDWDEHPKVLWSSFVLNLKDLILPDRQKDGLRVFWLPQFKGDRGAAMLPFKMVKGATARHEMAMRRNPKPPFEPSPREGVDGYVYKESKSFFILHAGLESPDQGELFINLLEQYRLEYCYPLG